MALPLSTPQPQRLTRAVAIGAGALGAILLPGALILWLHYGTAVFFEMIASGIASCF